MNSKRLGAAYLHRIAAELGLPTTAPLKDVRQMIDGKLLEESKEPRNVQITVGVDEGGAKQLTLQDAGGIFLEITEGLDSDELTK